MTNPEKAPDRVILVYDGEGGLAAMLRDVYQKLLGREECPLCEIVYSPLGKRRAWRACEAQLGMPIESLHRDGIPAEWGLAQSELPCILARRGDAVPTVLVSREEILGCDKSVTALAEKLHAALARGGSRSA